MAKAGDGKLPLGLKKFGCVIDAPVIYNKHTFGRQWAQESNLHAFLTEVKTNESISEPIRERELELQEEARL